MANGLVTLGTGRILPPPRNSVMNFIGAGSGGGDPGGGYNPGSNGFGGFLYPNSDEATAYSWTDASTVDYPIVAKADTFDTIALSAEENNTLSVNDTNYVELAGTGGIECVGHAINWDLSGFSPAGVNFWGRGYAWQEGVPTYGFLHALWDYAGTDYDFSATHEESEPAGLLRTANPVGDFISGGGEMSSLIQGWPGVGEFEDTYLRHYFYRIGVWE